MSEAEAENPTNHDASTSDSDNLVFTRSKASESYVESEEHETVLILPTSIPSSLWLRSRLRFSLDRKSSYDSDSNSVASENQPLLRSVHCQYTLLSFFLIAELRWPEGSSLARTHDDDDGGGGEQDDGHPPNRLTGT